MQTLDYETKRDAKRKKVLCCVGLGRGEGVEGAEPVKKVFLWKRETKIF